MALRTTSETTPETTSEHIMLRSVVVGQTFAGVYAVIGIQERAAKTGDIFSDIMMADRSGQVQIRIWKCKASEYVKKGDWAQIEASVDEYMGKPQIIAHELSKVDQPESLVPYMPVNENTEAEEKVFGKMHDKILEWGKSISDHTCGLILDSVYTEDFFKKFKLAPGSNKPCYGMVGGALSKSVHIAQTVNSLAAHYKLDIFEGSIALTGALLHPVGCVWAYDFESCQAVETRNGALFGPGFLTAAQISFVVRSMIGKKDFNTETAQRLMHAIVSTSYCGAKPATKEAIVLSSAVFTDRETAQAVDVINCDVNPDDEFTAFDPISGRKYFKHKSLST